MLSSLLLTEWLHITTLPKVVSNYNMMQKKKMANNLKDLGVSTTAAR